MVHRIKTLSSALLLLIATFAAHARAAVNPPPQVVPAVQRWDASDGFLAVRESPIIVEEKHRSELLPLAKSLQADLQEIGCGRRELRIATASAPGAIFLQLVPASVDGNSIPMASERYATTVDDRVVLSACSPTGAYYGTRTLLQLLAQNPKEAKLPKGRIVDYPVYKHRMLMLDVGRKPFPIEVLKDYLRIMAWYKMNELHLHLSDEAFGGGYTGFRVECDTFPGLASKDCFYTKKQLRELQDMAKSMGITITPEIDMPGHARVFTNYWPDLCLKGYPNYLDVTNPQTVERLKKLLDEMIPIFDAPDFHIGTDEYRVAGPRQEELHEAFRRFINTMNDHIRSKGKNCRIWSGFEQMKGKTEIDPSVIIDMWETRDAKGQIAKGHAIINSSDGRTYIVPGAHYYGVSNAGIYNSWEPWMVASNPAMNPAKDDPKLLGGKLHIWNDQGPTGYTHNEIARLALPSIQVFAEKLWGTKGSKDYAEFQKRAEVVRSTGFSRNWNTIPPDSGTRNTAIPGVRILNRAVVYTKDDLVMNHVPELGYDEIGYEMQLRDPIDDDAIDLATIDPDYLSSHKPPNLSWPWTLRVKILKPAERDTRGVILSSDLAEICTDYSRVEEVAVKGPDGKPVKKKVTRRGIGLIRAAGTPGKDAASSHLVNDVSRVYSDPLPLNKWVSLTIVGERQRTTVYIDGQKVGESGEQMLCPLVRFGSKTGQSFGGKIRGLKVWDRALSAKTIGHADGLDIPDNLAAHCVATASASDTEHGLTPEKITDEAPSTRWSSGMTQAEQWVAIDLGKPVEFNSLTVAWEAARPKKLRLQVPEGQDKWKDVCDIDVSGERTVAAFPMVRAARVRLVMSQPATQWGYSIWEVEVLKKK